VSPIVGASRSEQLDDVLPAVDKASTPRSRPGSTS
jgi:hypothetical protein